MLEAYIGGVEVTDVVQDASSEHWLNKTYVGTVKIPVAQAGADATGERLKLVDTDLPVDIDFHGIIKNCNAAEGGEYDGLVEYTAYSAREILEWRPARNGPASGDAGNYIKPTFLDLLKGGLIMEDVLTQSADGSDPADGEGDLFMDITSGTFHSDGVDLNGAPMNTPMTIEQLASILASTGEFDMVETMIDSGGNMSRIDTYPGDYAGIGSGALAYEPDGNVRAIAYTRDMSKTVNKLRYLLGPRIRGFEGRRWRRSIEATNTDIPDTSTYTQADLVTMIMASRTTYGVRADIRIFDSFNNEFDAVPLYWRLWQDESLWRAQPRLLVKFTPIEGLYPTFDVGTILDVSWHADFMGGGSGQQRCYGRKISWDVDGVARLDQVMTSSDADTLA